MVPKPPPPPDPLLDDPPPVDDDALELDEVAPEPLLAASSFDEVAPPELVDALELFAIEALLDAPAPVEAVPSVAPELPHAAARAATETESKASKGRTARDFTSEILT